LRGLGRVDKGRLDLMSANCMHVLKYHTEPNEYVLIKNKIKYLKKKSVEGCERLLGQDS
jgi:hypothetical protein